MNVCANDCRMRAIQEERAHRLAEYVAPVSRSLVLLLTQRVERSAGIVDLRAVDRPDGAAWRGFG